MKLRNDQKWWPAACNCDNCRESGWRVPTLATLVATQNGYVNVVFGEPGGVRVQP